MENKIKAYTELCGIHEAKEELIRNRELLFKIEREMARMVLDYEVGTYAHMLDEYITYINRWYECESAMKTIDLHNKLRLLENSEKIDKYRLLRVKYHELLRKLGDYGKKINIDFRNEFSNEEVPEIFVYQGQGERYREYSFARNIVTPELAVIFKRKSAYTIIYPEYELQSNREYRHFYNKVSFKYLEAMTEDYCFDLETKDLGKVKIKK